MPRSNAEKRNLSGQFFEKVGHRILGGELTRNESDITLWKEETCVEVKSSCSSSSYGFRLDLNQIRQNEEMASGFPFNRALYLLFSYRNKITRRDGRRRTEFSYCRTEREINAYLAKAILWCVVIDISIVAMWRRTKPISTKSIMSHLGTKTVNIKCQEVHTLANGGFSEEIASLGLKPEDYAVLEGEARVHVLLDQPGKRKLRFPITAILRKEEAEWGRSLFRRRYIHLEHRGVPAQHKAPRVF